MELSSSEVYEVLNPLTKAKDPTHFIATLRQLCARAPITRDAADNLTFYTVSALYYLDSNDLLEEGIRVVEAYLDLCDPLSISPAKRWYFVEKALAVIKSKPELADKLVTQVIKDTVTEELTFIRTTKRLAELGRKDLTLSFSLQAIAFNFDFDISMESLSAIKKFYVEDEHFKQQIDLATKQQTEKTLRLTNPADFASTLEAAREATHNLSLSYSNPQRIFALINFKEEQYRTEIENFLGGGFQELKAMSLRSGELVDHVLYDALARAIGIWGAAKFGDLLMQEFNFVTADDDQEALDHITRHYELNLTCGTIATVLAALDYAGDISGFDVFLESFEWRYQGSDFVMQTRYAKWLLSKDGAAALAFLQDSQNTSGASYAVSALADLDYKPALAAIKRRQASLRNPVTKEVFKEAIARLEQQAQAPLSKDRIIALFGRVTATEMALGEDSDNIFLLRAQQTLQDSTLGTVYEIDAAGPED